MAGKHPNLHRETYIFPGGVPEGIQKYILELIDIGVIVDVEFK